MLAIQRTKVWVAREGSRINNAQAEIIGRFLVRKEGKGKIPTHTLARELSTLAEDPEHELHQLPWEWDNTTAAQKYRLVQAREFLRSVDSVYVLENHPEPVQARNNVHLHQVKEGSTIVVERGYYLMDKALMSDPHRRAMLFEAKQGLNAWLKKYRILKIMGAAVEAVEAVEKAQKSLSEKGKKKKNITKEED